jgi:hypothetical protein
MTPHKPRKERGAGAPIHAKQARSIVAHTRRSSEELVAAGIDRKRLESRLARIEKHLDQEDHDPAELRLLLTELETDLIQVENKLISSGVLPALHLILGTGVPPPR